MKAATNNSKVRTGINNMVIQCHKIKKKGFCCNFKKNGMLKSKCRGKF